VTGKGQTNNSDPVPDGSYQIDSVVAKIVEEFAEGRHSEQARGA